MSAGQSSPNPPVETQYIAQPDDSQNLWEAECILDERGPAVTGAYLVKWRGIDPDTGNSYEPTWESKDGCTQDLISDWKKLKKADPSIVGKAGQALLKAKESKKRKRSSIGRTSASREKKLAPGKYPIPI